MNVSMKIYTHEYSWVENQKTHAWKLGITNIILLLTHQCFTIKIKIVCFFQVPGVGAASKFASLEPPDTAASVSGFGDCGSGSGVGSEVDSAWDHFRNHRF